MGKREKWHNITDTLFKGSEDNVFPGAVLLVKSSAGIEYTRAVGRIADDSKSSMTEKTVFDVASLTKILCTTTMIMTLVRDSEISLENKIARYFSSDEIVDELKNVTVEDILTHQSGLKAYVPFFKDAFERGEEFVRSDEARNYIFSRARKEPFDYRTGENFKYSDLGFIVLTEIIERLLSNRLDYASRSRIFGPLGMNETHYIPWREKWSGDIYPKSKIAPTEAYEWLGKEICGVVHDENCYMMGGVSGHAGLFSTIGDISRFTDKLFECHEGSSDFLSKNIAKKFFTKRGLIPNSPWAIGFKTPSKEDKSSGKYFSDNSIGHLGFTGCSIWIDLKNKLSIVLMTNRVNIARDNNKIRKFRPLIHDLVMEILKS